MSLKVKDTFDPNRIAIPVDNIVVGSDGSTASTTHLPEGTNLYYTDERVDDRVGALFIDSASVDFTYNDGANTLTAVVIANTTNQQINVSKAGTSVGTRKQLNFIEGSNITLTVADNSGADRIDVTIASTPAAVSAPVTATYITQTPNATLTSEQALSELESGLLVNTTTTGVLTVPKITAGPNGALQTTGTGYGTVVGNARGTSAVDLQTKRTLAANVASNTYSTIGGGVDNKASGQYSVVSGGQNNFATELHATVCGGQNNIASSIYATVSGGFSNTASDINTTVGGGKNNTASGSHSIVSGGYANTASGQASCISGGYGNVTSGEASSIPGGYNATASHYGQQSHAAGKFATNGDAQRSSFIAKAITTNATQTELFLDIAGTLRLTLANDTSWSFRILIVARRTDADGESACFEFSGCIDRQTNAASTALVDTVIEVIHVNDDVTWDAVVNADTTNGSLRIQVTGAASKTINWVAHIDTVETTG